VGEELATGDLGYFRNIDGQTYYFISGRKRDVIKRYAETVSLRDVDDLFRSFFDSGDCIAVGFANDLAGEELGLVLRDPPAAFESKLQDFITRQIPAMFRPRVIVCTPRDLRTPSGKPRRWQFQNLFIEYKTVQFGNQIVFRSEGAD